MSLPRERATSKADLPHAYEGVAGVNDCTICSGSLFDDRHGDWEKALEQTPVEPRLPRETGT